MNNTSMNSDVWLIIKKLLGLQTSLGKASLNNVFDMIKYGDFSKYKMD